MIVKMEVILFLLKIFVTGKLDMWMKMIHLDDFINMQEFVTPLQNYVCGKQVKLAILFHFLAMT